MNKNKNRLFRMMITATLAIMAVFSAVGAAFVSTSAYNMDKNSSYVASQTVENKTHYYKCYAITDTVTINGTPVNNPVAIEWDVNKDNPSYNPVPSELTVNSTINYNNTNHTIVAIAPGGFRYCSFTKIHLPNTIVEMGYESFAYCTKLQEFTFPYYVTKIAPSTFLDCSSLVNIFYANAAGTGRVITSPNITEIGEHAFSSCSSLLDFNCAANDNLVVFGEGCFEKCTSLSQFYFPSKRQTGEPNNLTVHSYAFSDCSNLKWVYFEDNFCSGDVDDYVFVNCHEDLVFHRGTKVASPSDPTFNGSAYNWRRKTYQTNDDSQNTSYYPFEKKTNNTPDYTVILSDNAYPGLRYTIKSDDIFLDCSRAANPKKIFDNTVEGLGKEYAVIYKWDKPTETPENGYYNIGTKALTIPGTLTFGTKSYPVRSIAKEAFREKTNDIEEVIFGTQTDPSNLIQICERAFYKDFKISRLDFTYCTTLKEVGNGIFSDRATDETTGMINVNSLVLPDSIEFIGKYAFSNFRSLSSLTLPKNLKVLGGYSFGMIGMALNTAAIDIELPLSLSDADAASEKINFNESSNWNEQNWAAVGPYAFGARTDKLYTSVRTITMKSECDHEGHTEETCPYKNTTYSLAPNAFSRSKYMTKFIAGPNLKLIGADAFKGCNDIIEIRLTTAKAISSGKNYPWCTKDAGDTYDNSLVSGTGNKQNLVIYLDGEVPGNVANYSDDGDNKGIWNAEYLSTGSYKHELEKTNDKSWTYSRSSIPTLKNIDFNTILYWDVKNKCFRTDEPKVLDDYTKDKGTIVFAKEKNGTEYTAVKYYCKSGNVESEIDLTTIKEIKNNVTTDVSSTLTAIGAEAFASHDSLARGSYFILPDTIKEIGERAFYRLAGTGENDVANNGVRIVTYKTGDEIQGNYAATKTAYNNANPKKNFSGYCMLPASVERIERNAFYDNCFGSVSIGQNITIDETNFFVSNLSFVGKSAFYTHSTASDKIRSKLTSITIGTNKHIEEELYEEGDDIPEGKAVGDVKIEEKNYTNEWFDSENNGIYYCKNANKTLLYQSQGVTGTLSLASGTLAVGMHACANTSYTQINLNAELKQIYGGGFQNNLALTTVTGGSGLVSIGSYLAEEVYNSSLPFDIYDHVAVATQAHIDTFCRGMVFKNCANLTNFDFTQLSSLERIGYAAFNGCQLTNMVGTKKYSFYQGTKENNVYKETEVTNFVNTSSNILDLSGITGLKCIDKEAFISNSNLTYAILPNTTGNNHDTAQSNLVFGKDALRTKDNGVGKVFPDNTNILIGETYKQADINLGTKSLKPDNHYPSGAFGDTSKKYYRVFDTDDIETTTPGFKFWTCEEVKDNSDVLLYTKYILFEDKEGALAYFASQN